MTEPLWIYLMALLYFTKVSTCSSRAEVFADLFQLFGNLQQIAR
jgi:hypothetical protein